MEYKLTDGSSVTDEKLEQIAEEFESGEWKGHLENIRVSLPDREEPTKVLTFRLTVSRAAAVKAAAKRAGITQSDFIRHAGDRELAAMAEAPYHRKEPDAQRQRPSRQQGRRPSNGCRKAGGRRRDRRHLADVRRGLR